MEDTEFLRWLADRCDLVHTGQRLPQTGWPATDTPARLRKIADEIEEAAKEAHQLGEAMRPLLKTPEGVAELDRALEGLSRDARHEATEAT